MRDFSTTSVRCIGGCCLLLGLLAPVAADDGSAAKPIVIETQIGSYHNLSEKVLGSVKRVHPDDEMVCVGPVAANNDGSDIAVAVRDYFDRTKIVLFSMSDVKKPHVLSLPNGENMVELVAFTNDPNTLLTLTNKSYHFGAGISPPPTHTSLLRLWNTRSGRIVKETRTSDHAVGPVAISSVGDCIAYGLRDRDGYDSDEIRIVSMKQLALIGTVKCTSDDPVEVRFDPSGKRLLVVGSENIWVFDVATQRELAKAAIPKGGPGWRYWLMGDDKLHEVLCAAMQEGYCLVGNISVPLERDLTHNLAESQKPGETAMCLTPSSFIISPDGSSCMLNGILVDLKRRKARVSVFDDSTDRVPTVGLAFSADSRKVVYMVGPFFVLEDVETRTRQAVWYCADAIRKRVRIGPPAVPPRLQNQMPASQRPVACVGDTLIGTLSSTAGLPGSGHPALLDKPAVAPGEREDARQTARRR